MYIFGKTLEMLYLVFISPHMVLKENFSLIKVYIYKNIGHVVLNVYICMYGFERKFWYN